MFVSDAHLFVPREIRWTPIMALRFSAARRRKSLARRLKRDIRVVLPVFALVFTFAMTVMTAEFAKIVVPTGATQSPGAESVQAAVARIFAPEEAAPVHAERRAEEKETGPVAALPVRTVEASVAMLH